MRAIEPSEFLNARDLQARYGVSRMWLERHIKDHCFLRPIKFGDHVECSALAPLLRARVGNPMGAGNSQRALCSHPGCTKTGRMTAHYGRRVQ
jgi:hypothetical protein